MKVNKTIIEKIENQQGYTSIELFTVKINKELYTFYINKIVSWIDNKDSQYISVKHFTSHKQKEINAWNNRIIFSQQGNIPYSTLDLVYLNSKEKRVLNKFKNNIDNLLSYDL